VNYLLKVENIKCGGCANTIVKKLSSIDGVSNLEVDIENQEVKFDAESELQVEGVVKSLADMGYPLEGEGTGFQKAKSYVSCMIGKIS